VAPERDSCLLGETHVSWERLGSHGRDSGLLGETRVSWERLVYPGRDSGLLGETRVSWERLRGPGNVHKVVEEDRLLRAGYASGGHGSGAFPEVDALVVAVLVAQGVELEGSLRVAAGADAGLVEVGLGVLSSPAG
jgi:hypothetical protein